MKEVYFQSVLIADLQNHMARFQEFSAGLNVVTSSENHVGKSSLLKSLYYALGAEVGFDSVWDKNSKLYVVDFCVGEEKYRIARYMRRFAVFHGQKLLKITDSITNELAPFLGDVFGFAVYLPNKETEKVEMAPPAFTFMPYYIDQDTGWSGLYDSFSSINQYKKPDRIKSLYYHLNIYTKNTVELMARRDQLKERVERLMSEKERLSTVLSALNGEMENLPPADDIIELENHLKIPQKRIEELVKKIGESRNSIQALETTLHQHQHQLEVINEYHSMKTEIIDASNITPHTCPKCGYIFDEEIFNIVKANYSALNGEYMCQQIQLIIDSIQCKLSMAKESYVDLMQQLKKEEAVFVVEKDEFEVYVKQRGLQNSLRHFSADLDKNRVDIFDTSEDIKAINKEIIKLPKKKEVEEKYIEYVRLNIMKLNAWDPTYDDNIRLLKPIKAQGTLENKIILAQFIGLFQTMEYFKSSATRFPFVVDSPRAKEPSYASSVEILKMIAGLKMLPQIILATMDYLDYQDEVETAANIITLTEPRKLLRERDYIENEPLIIGLQELLKNQN